MSVCVDRWPFSCDFLIYLFLQDAEQRNQELEDKVRALQKEVEESKHRQGHLKLELKHFLNILDGKIDDFQEFRQGLSKLEMDS